MKLDEFISRWSVWWILNKDRETLGRAFRKELEALRQPEFKPLEWNIYGGGWISQPLGLYYRIWKPVYSRLHPEYDVTRLQIGRNGTTYTFPSESEAKEFAQKDFESKVMKYIIKK